MAAVQLPSRMSISDEPSKKRGSVSRLFNPFKSSKQSSPRSSIDSGRSSIDFENSSMASGPRRLSKLFASDEVQELPTREKKPLKKSTLSPSSNANDPWERDRQTGEVKDHTNMLHSLAHEQDFDESPRMLQRTDTDTPASPGETISSRLPSKIWDQILVFLSLPDKASFAFSCKAFRNLLHEDPWVALKESKDEHQRIDFLIRLDKQLPSHLLCFSCAKYHLRLHPGEERLRPMNVANPVFNCPYASSTDPAKKISRVRITFGRALPFPFAQLVMREHRFGSKYGITADSMSRRYKDREEIGTWSHQTRYAVIEDKLYMRVVSTCFAPPNLPPAGERHLLYSREDFVPFFSVCSHWRDGVLMPTVKCALSHVPKPLEGGGLQRVGKEIEARMRRPSSNLVVLCENCRPLRRCPECPTEYLIEIRLSEDRSENDPTKLFKHALVVTRWSELGDGTAPWNPEWATIIGQSEGHYNSFQAIGKRAISGVFESFFNPEQIPPARMVSLNPNNEKLGEKGHNWY